MLNYNGAPSGGRFFLFKGPLLAAFFYINQN